MKKKTPVVRLDLPLGTEALILCKNRGIGIEPYALVSPEQVTPERLQADAARAQKDNENIVELYAYPVKLFSYIRLYSTKEGLLCGSKTSPARAKNARAKRTKRNATPKPLSVSAPTAVTETLPSPLSEVANSASTSA